MFSVRRVIAAATLIAGTSCRSHIPVQTTATPIMGLGTLRSFRILPAATPRNAGGAPAADDPMAANSGANGALRQAITTALQARGYSVDETNPDFVVAFYASTRGRLDVTAWSYGVPFDTLPVRLPTPTQYDPGTVIIDVLRPASRDLLWRGQARADVTGDPPHDADQLARIAGQIVASFPNAPPRVVAAQP